MAIVVRFGNELENREWKVEEDDMSGGWVFLGVIGKKKMMEEKEAGLW